MECEVKAVQVEAKFSSLRFNNMLEAFELKTSEAREASLPWRNRTRRENNLMLILSLNLH